MDARLIAGLREQVESVAQDHEAASQVRRDAALILGVLDENTILREQVDQLESRLGPAAMLPSIERLLRAAGDLLEAAVVASGDSLDNVLTQVRLAEARVTYERKALG